MAYGSLYQWGRYSDGHELITYTNGTSASPVNGLSTSRSDAPTHAKFIIRYSEPYTYDWRVNRDDTLWDNESSTNNPCPVGYRLPLESEFLDLITAAAITDKLEAASSSLAFSLPGYRKATDGSLDRTSGIRSILDYYYSSRLAHGLLLTYGPIPLRYRRSR